MLLESLVITLSVSKAINHASVFPKPETDPASAGSL
jgi:hypothetical protein